MINIPSNSPFSDKENEWLQGYYAGLESQVLEKYKNGNENSDLKTISILFGTQTGNSEIVAREAEKVAKKAGLTPTVLDLSECETQTLISSPRLLIVTSTYGEGEMPDNVIELWNKCSELDDNFYEKVNYSVLALGDTSYEKFCEAGKLWDLHLNEKGGKRVLDCVECDVDFEEPSRRWIKEIIPAMTEVQAENEKSSIIVDAKENRTDQEKNWSRNNPYLAKLNKKIKLSKKGSGKEIIHYEIDLGESQLSYKPGDIVNIFSRNDDEYVSLLLDSLKCDGSEVIYVENLDEKKDLKYLLQSYYEIRKPSKDLLNLFYLLSKDSEFCSIYEDNDKSKLTDFLHGMDTLDLIEKFNHVPLNAIEFCRLCKPLSARAYSISSSIDVHPNEVHITVASVRWEKNKRVHKGVCSTFLADILNKNEELGLYFSTNNNFRIPENGEKNMIMIGPGTGIAPFRSFLQQREFNKCEGENWLFFGDRNKNYDYIYESEILGFQKRGVLNKIDLAWSRDQDEKIYVQDLLIKNKKEIFGWIQNGSHIYVCGDALYMAKDVNKALINIISTEGSLSYEDAADYLNDLKNNNRYSLDVY